MSSPEERAIRLVTRLERNETITLRSWHPEGRRRVAAAIAGVIKEAVEEAVAIERAACCTVIVRAIEARLNP